jgi:putative YphP/YqiW family bacilliredoxin
MMYDERFITPMRQELTRIGFEEMKTAADVDSKLGDAKGTALVVVNSMCGCAARNARPALATAVQHAVKPEQLLTVFAGQDPDATGRARDYIVGYAPSSPSIALFKDGKLVYMMERWQIEGRTATDITADLVHAFDAHCASSGSVASAR